MLETTSKTTTVNTLAQENFTKGGGGTTRGLMLVNIKQSNNFYFTPKNEIL